MSEREDLIKTLEILNEAIELNLSNYTHEEVCMLNNKMIEAFKFVNDAIRRANP